MVVVGSVIFWQKATWCNRTWVKMEAMKFSFWTLYKIYMCVFLSRDDTLTLWQELKSVTLKIDWDHCERHLEPAFDQYNCQVTIPRGELYRSVYDTLRKADAIRPALENNSFLKGIVCSRRYVSPIGLSRTGSSLHVLHALILRGGKVRTLYAAADWKERFHIPHSVLSVSGGVLTALLGENGVFTRIACHVVSSIFTQVKFIHLLYVWNERLWIVRKVIRVLVFLWTSHGQSVRHLELKIFMNGIYKFCAQNFVFSSDDIHLLNYRWQISRKEISTSLPRSVKSFMNIYNFISRQKGQGWQMLK